MIGRKKRRLRVPALVLAAVLLGSAVFAAYTAFAAEETASPAAKKKGTTYYRYTKELGNKINAGTLFVGTYLIDLRGLNETNYQDALGSRKTYHQDNMYYKTEIDDASWHNIENAKNIATISPGSERIDEDSMRDLLITVVIGKDGLPKDPEGGGAKNPFEDPDPYGLSGLEELQPLLEVYENGKFTTNSELYTYQRLRYFFAHCKLEESPVKDDDGTAAANIFDWERKEQDEAAIKKLEKLYDKAEGRLRVETDETLPFSADAQEAAQRIVMHFSDTRDDYTARMDGYLAGTWEIYLDYKDKEKSEEADVLYELNGNIDAERRARVFYNLVESKVHHRLNTPILSSLLSDMVRYGKAKTGRYYAYMNGGDDNFAAMDEAVKATETSIKNCEASLARQREKGLVRGNTAISQYAYDAKMDLIPKKKGDEGINAPVQSLVSIKHIKADEIADRDRELSLLKDYLVPLENEILGEYLTRGVPADYDTAGADAEKRAILEPMQQEARDAVEEIEKYDNWTLQRLAGEEEQKAFLNSQINWVENIQKKLLADDFLGYAETVRQEYEDWLKRRRDDLASDNGGVLGGGSTGGGGGGKDPTGNIAGSLNGEPTDGESYSPSDPDPGDRAIYYDGEAKKALEREDIGSYKRYKEMADREREEARLTGGGGNTARNAASQSGNDGGGSGHNAYRPASWKGGMPDTGLNLNKKDTADSGKSTAANGADGTGKNGNDNASGSTAGTANASSADAKSAAAALKDRNKDKEKKTGGRTLGDSEVLSAIEELLGQPFGSLPGDLQAAVISALNEYGVRHEDRQALALARRLLDQTMGDRNPLAYRKLSGLPYECVSFGAIDRSRNYSGYRLVEEKSDGTQALSSMRSDKSFTFKPEKLAGRQTDAYIRGSQTEEYAYIDEAVSLKKIKCRAEYISDTEYALLVTKSMESVIKETVNRLEEMAGY